MRRAVVFDRVRIFGALFFVLLALLGGCATNTADNAKSTARRFITAMDSGDENTARETMTALAKRRMTEMGATAAKENTKTSGETGYTLGDAQIDGENANVTVTFTEKEQNPHHGTVEMRFEEGQWRVYAFALETVPGEKITMDFEHPENNVAEAFRGLGQAMGAAMKGLGEGMGAFVKGMGEGAAAMRRATKDADNKMAHIEQGTKDATGGFTITFGGGEASTKSDDKTKTSDKK